MTEHTTFNVLFLCTGNSCRSIIAEAILNAIGGGRFRAFSAGSHPTGSVHPMALEAIARLHFPLGEPRSKSWDEFGGADGPHMHFVITLCDQAAGETCPRWPGHPITAHWSFEDPAACAGGAEERSKAFARVCREIKSRLDIFSMLPMEKLSRMAIQEAVSALGRQDADAAQLPD